MNSELQPGKLKLLSACNVLIAANIAVFAFAVVKEPAMWWLPGNTVLKEMGGNYGILTFSGEYWRLITAMFLHVGIVHLAVNLYGLYCVGPTAQSLFGWRMFLLIYFFSGIMGGLTSVLHDPLATSVGASGAILGLFGSLLAFMYVHRDKYPRRTLQYYAALTVGLFIATVIYGQFETGIDQFNHGGGFIAGAIAGLILARMEVKEGLRAAYAVPVMILMIGLWFWAIHNNFERRGYADYADATRAIKAGNLEQAVRSLNMFISRDQSEANAYGLRAIAYLKLNKLDLALTDYNKLVELKPDTPGGYNDRAWTECGLSKWDQAIKDATKSLELSAKNPATYDTRGYAYAHSGETEKALADFAEGLKYASTDTACHYHRMKLYESLGKTSDADSDRQAAAAYKPEAWER